MEKYLGSQDPGSSEPSPNLIWLLQLAAADLQQTTVRAGQEIWPEGRPNPPVIHLTAGWAARYRTLPGGGRQIVRFLLPGDVAGLHSQFFGAAISALQAVTNVSLVEIRPGRLREAIEQAPELGYEIGLLAAREKRDLEDHLLVMGQDSGLGKVAFLLTALFRRGNRAGLVSGSLLPFPLTQRHVGGALGLSVVHVNRMLQQLQSDGLVRLKRGRLELLDERRLAAVGHVPDRPDDR
ncbi:Crp/Fnr family transcriptional regulator [Mycobacterium sp. KBS0706]|uniref:Crp/Fnr family transcriptional regulator n=1 Tax=Mycobacterium sp. KBS0706 TaxID=2578109 RepID=UPI00110F8C03|nr:Crp/Fnr family transcriptional regulator [Mycobacterium sp. KBS0706]TSD89604.1 Crp/Fnr family transcriptional regulator [Mycobacterium sp. KBS0706]